LHERELARRAQPRSKTLAGGVPWYVAEHGQRGCVPLVIGAEKAPNRAWAAGWDVVHVGLCIIFRIIRSRKRLENTP
jgi:hypothetical protein